MNYLIIKNKGIIAEEALTLLGASSKREDNSTIGMFGTGNKYALAYLLREGFKVHIHAGILPIDIELRPKYFRGLEFNILVVNGKETSITTETGLNWELWQAIRELYANATDEGLLRFEYIINGAMPISDPDTTSIVIEDTEDNKLQKLINNIDNLILPDRAEILHSNSYGDIIKKLKPSRARIYYKGIRVHTTKEWSFFDYNLNQLAITEDRIAKYNWQINEHIWKLLSSIKDENILRSFLIKEGHDFNSNIKFIEDVFGYDSIESQIKSNPVWEKVLKTLTLIPKSIIGTTVGLLDTVNNLSVVDDNIYKELQKVDGFSSSIEVIDNNTVTKFSGEFYPSEEKYANLKYYLKQYFDLDINNIFMGKISNAIVVLDNDMNIVINRIDDEGDSYSLEKLIYNILIQYVDRYSSTIFLQNLVKLHTYEKDI